MPSQSRIVQTLVTKGLVTRRADENDRRRVRITITDGGHGIILNNLDSARAIAKRIEKHLGKQKLDALLETLAELEQL